MIIDIKRTVIKTHLRRLITLVCFTLVILILILVVNPKLVFIGVDRYKWALIISVFYILSIIIESLFELNYIYFSDEDNKIILRYFSMSVFNKKKNSIEIPKKLFAGYQIINFLNGWKKKIILVERVKDKEAKYPAVSLSGLNKKQLKLILSSLDKF